MNSKKRAQQALLEYNKKRDENFEILKPIGQGGFSTVYDLKDSDLVVKVGCLDSIDTMFGHSSTRSYFQNEISFMKKTSGCAHLMDIKDSFIYHAESDEETILIFMDRMIPLTEYLKDKVVDYGLIFRLANHIGSALSVLEEHHLLHRDIKPTNLFVREGSGEPFFVLGDFGVVRELKKRDAAPITALGTPGFAAPEFLNPGTFVPSNYASDFFSVGCTFFTLITGEVYNMFSPTDCEERIRERMPNMLPILQKCLQIDPRDRYQNAAEFLSDLSSAQVPTARDRIIAEIRLNATVVIAQNMLLDGKISQAYGLLKTHYSESRRNALWYAFVCILSKKFEEADAVLEELISDPPAMYLYGILRFLEKDYKRGQYYLSTAAEEGNVPAQYLAGRVQYFEETAKQCGWVYDPVNGEEYIRSAAVAGFLPAIRVLKKIEGKSQSGIDLDRYEETLQVSIIKCLETPKSTAPMR